MRIRRVLDLGCKVGFASDGIARVLPGVEIVGVDIEPQSRYPYTFVQGDMLKFDLSGFDFVWASPPCQRYCLTLRGKPFYRFLHPDLVDSVRERLVISGVPFIMENVVGSPLIPSVVLCGSMFGLKTFRHRVFESNFLLLQPVHVSHRKLGLRVVRQGYAAYLPGEMMSVTGHFSDRLAGASAMGITRYATKDELANAVPPVFAEYLVKQIVGCL